MNNTITQENVTTTPSTEVSPTMARLSWVAAATSLGLLVTLHGLSPEFDPSWRMVSEYALGDYRWVLTLMFLTMAVSCVALFVAIRSQIRTMGGKIGLGFLLVSALGQTLASIFDIQHPLHGLTALLGIPSIVIAALLITVSLVRNPAWSGNRRLLLWLANFPWMALVLMVATMFIGLSRTGGEMGPTVLIGWPNRLLIVAYSIWPMVVAWRAAQFEVTH